jgi:hypothetical protein
MKMKGSADISMVTAMVRTTNTNALLQGSLVTTLLGMAFGNHSHHNPQTLHHQASF